MEDGIVQNYTIVSQFERIIDRLDSLENLVNANQVDFIEFADSNPVLDEIWAEARLRALEMQMKQLMEMMNTVRIVNGVNDD